MALFDSIFGSSQQKQQYPTLNPQQQQISSQAGQQLMSLLGGGMGRQGGFAPIRENALNTFNQQIAPSIAERFTGLNGQRSSGYQNSLNQAGANLASNLGAQEVGYNQNLMSLLASLSQQPQYETQVNAAQPGLLQSLLPLLIQYGPGILGGIFGGPAGAAVGGAAGSALGSSMSNSYSPSNVGEQNLQQLFNNNPYGNRVI